MRRSSLFLALVSLAPLPALGCATPEKDQEAAVGGDRLTQATFDPDRGAWQTLQVSDSPGTISHDGRLAFLPNGKAIAVWSDPDSQDYSIQNIWSASLGSGGRTGERWVASPPLTTNTATQNAFPSIVPVGSALHVVWNGSPGGDHDIFHVGLQAGQWSATTDLTSAFDASPLTMTDYLPVLAAAPNGTLAVAYNTTTPKDEPIAIRVLRLDARGEPTGAPFVALDPAAAGGACYGAAVEFDADGYLHVVAECGPAGEERLWWGTDASGSWVARPIDAFGRADVQAQLARAPGRTVALVWSARTADGTNDIATATIEGSRISPARAVTRTPGASDLGPRAAVDASGRLFVAYTSNRDIHAVWSTGETFSAPKNLTPDSDAIEHASDLAIDPATGAPHVLYTKVIRGTQPLNAEIMHTFWTADPR